MLKSRKSIRLASILIIIVTLLSINALAYSFTIAANDGVNDGYKDVFTSQTLSKSNNVKITQTSSTSSRGVRYVLQRVSNSVEMDYDYLYGSDSTTLNAVFDNVSSRLRAFNEYSTSTTAVGSYSIS